MPLDNLLESLQVPEGLHLSIWTPSLGIYDKARQRLHSYSHAITSSHTTVTILTDHQLDHTSISQVSNHRTTRNRKVKAGSPLKPETSRRGRKGPKPPQTTQHASRNRRRKTEEDEQAHNLFLNPASHQPSSTSIAKPLCVNENACADSFPAQNPSWVDPFSGRCNIPVNTTTKKTTQTSEIWKKPVSKRKLSKPQTRTRRP